MSDDTDILGLPLILPAQAQKHVTHNEALLLLDLLVQLAVLNRDLTAPPALALRGDRHLVAAGGLSEWAGQDGKIAVLTETGWNFVPPQPGWHAHVLAEGVSVMFDGLEWRGPRELIAGFAALGLGGAIADASNRLASAAPATLLSHAGAGHQLKINKSAAAETASLLFQTGWSGRAEMGTAGSDAFSIKVSPNGSSWATGVSVAAATGKADFPNGVTRAGAELYGRDTLLGVVSQSAGSPTGAVIERGTNATGAYLRLADGTQICTTTSLTAANASTAAGSGFRSANVVWNFPVAFAAGATPVVSGMVDDLDCVLSQSAPGISSVTLRALALVSKSSSLTLRATAIGRWF